MIGKRINGKEISEEILKELAKKVAILKAKGKIPHLVIILIANDPSSKAYVGQKILKAKEIGVKTTIVNLSSDISKSKLQKIIEEFNNDKNVHGLIVQRPLPRHIDNNAIAISILPQKDVDGLSPNSPFPMPLAAAVIKLLESINETKKLASKKVAVIGKGPTGGEPVIAMLRDKLGVQPLIINSKTQNPSLVTKNADIIISAVGKPNILNSQMIKKGSVLISVGLHKESDGKLHGDYEEEEIKHIASFYTPTPGGVGPVNVAMLLQNLVNAASRLA